MDDENKDQEQQNNLIRRNADQINDAIRKKVKENAKKNAAAKSKIAAASGPVIFWGVVIIVAIIVIIGIIMFLITMPGMVMDKIKSIGKTIADGWHSWWGRDDAKNVTDEEIYKALDYLDEMGYDLKGFGFLTDYVEGEKKGFKVDDDNKIVKATSDFIKVYLASDNYVYTLKNHNLVAGTWDAFVQHVGQFFGGSFSTKLTRGLIAVYKERGGVLGQRESSLFSDSGLFNGDKMKLDVKAKTLTLRKGFNNKELTYSLDGWTGRYGMPVDFLMSVHVATMMPDLAYDMANHFDTEIELILHGVSNSSIQPAYKTEDGTYVTFDDIAQGANQTGILQDPIEWLRDKVGTSNFTDEEAQATMADFKITNINSENQTDAEFMTELLGRLDRERDNNFHYYIPYIGRVKNHWYRDVYYAITNDSTELVKVDYDYESKFKERWTIYETYTKNEDPERAGEFKIYALNKNGGYATSAEDIENYSPEIFVKEPETGYFLFRGSIEDQKKALQGEDITGVRYNVAKKAKTLNSTNTSELEDLGWHEDAGTWSAYKKEGSITTAWERLYPESEDPIEQRIYIRVGGATNIKQTGEGQRGETNPDIKKMFLVNEYFRYDGTQETAEAITALRKKLKSDIVENDGSEYGPLNELPYKKGAFKDVRDLSYTATELGINGSASQIMQEDDDGKLVEVDREYKISDFIGKVTINQDSLNAFSMLENTHTLDSDYIYRDFKELIVELGYFEKEELTDEIPRLLEFPVPEIGSYNYPKREIDKRENEYGTMIHSKGDIDAYKALSLKQYLEDFEISEGEYQETHEPYEHFTVDDREFYFDEGGKLHPVDPTQFTEGEHVWIQSKEYVFYGGEFILVEKEPQEEEPHPHEGRDEDYEEEEEEEEEIELDVSGIDTSNIGTDLGATIANVLEKADELQKINSSLDMVETSDTSNDNISHAITTELGGPASFEVQINCTAEEFCEYAAQVHAVMENSAWGYCNGRSDHGPSNGHTEHGVYTTQAKAEAGRKTVDCSTFVCWVLQAAGVVPEGWRTNSHGLINTPEFQPYLLTREDAGEPQPGDILLMDYKGVNGHAQINGEDNIQYNCGGTAAIRSKPKKSRAFIDGTSSNPDHKYEYILRLFSSNTKKANPYEGYKGNDAVVSPVTGILLEYGTYTNEDMDSISQEQYRVNVDLKYGPLIESPKVERQIISDKVGYAKILVLDADTYQKIESELIKHSSEAFRKEVGDSLL